MLQSWRHVVVFFVFQVLFSGFAFYKICFLSGQRRAAVICLILQRFNKFDLNHGSFII